MAYNLFVGESRRVVDLAGNPIPASAISDPSGTPPPFAIGLAASMTADVDGNLVAHGNALTAGLSFNLRLVATGALAAHEIVVAAPPFDWTLED